mmetsp:Transcript_3868/g.8691  ORF Transcript_3868/g.8691 Transcript_3868/m.8691 type:complete len:225 (+) Transcript_3868:1121-1795(+)
MPRLHSPPSTPLSSARIRDAPPISAPGATSASHRTPRTSPPSPPSRNLPHLSRFDKCHRWLGRSLPWPRGGTCSDNAEIYPSIHHNRRRHRQQCHYHSAVSFQSSRARPKDPRIPRLRRKRAVLSRCRRCSIPPWEFPWLSVATPWERRPRPHHSSRGGHCCCCCWHCFFVVLLPYRSEFHPAFSAHRAIEPWAPRIHPHHRENRLRCPPSIRRGRNPHSRIWD